MAANIVGKYLRDLRERNRKSLRREKLQKCIFVPKRYRPRVKEWYR